MHGFKCCFGRGASVQFAKGSRLPNRPGPERKSSRNGLYALRLEIVVTARTIKPGGSTTPLIDRLPAPGEAPPPGTQLATISDPDVEAQRSQEELEKEHAEFCEKNYNEHDASTDSVEGPLGPCRKSILTAVKKWNSE